MRILILSSFTKSLVWFRMSLMDELVALGHEVWAMGEASSSEYAETFSEHGINYASYSVSRNGLSPAADIRTYAELRAGIEMVAPDVVLAYQAKPIVYGCVAARHAGVVRSHALVAGLGSVLRGTGLRNKVIGAVLSAQYRYALRACRSVFFQNPDDRDEFISRRLVSVDQSVLVNGSGVDIARFEPTPIPPLPAFLFIGRLLRDKGIVEYMEAAASVRRRHPSVRCMVVGPFDTNPSAVTVEELQDFVGTGVVEYLGELSDVRPAIAQCSVFVLPSYHEGTPKSVLEAMAMGRAIITTDAPGCRETVVDGENGYLVPVGDAETLADRMCLFVETPELAGRLGHASRRMAEDKYDVRKVNAQLLRAMELTTESVESRTDLL